MEVLHIPSVLRKILKNLDSSSLGKRCRLVNKDWNWEACKILETRTTVSFSKLEEIERYNQTTESSLATVSINFKKFCFHSSLFCEAITECAFGSVQKLQSAIEQFTNVSRNKVESLNVSIYPIFSIQGNKFSQNHAAFLVKIVLHMIYHDLPKLKSLQVQFLLSHEVNNCSLNTEELEVLKEKFVTKKLENLKYLALDLYGETDPDSDNRFEAILDFLKNLISSATKLQAIRLTSEINPHYLNSEAVSTLTFSIPQDCQYSLKSLVILNNLKEVDLYQLTSRPFPNLESIHCRVGIENVSVDCFTEFLSAYSDTLTCLRITFVKNIENVWQCVPFPPSDLTLKSLKNLHLEGSSGRLILRNMPKLKTLHVSQTDNDISKVICSQDIEKATKCRYCALEEFKISGIPRDPAVSNVPPEVPYWFSRLTELNISFVYGIKLASIFEKCKQLRKLKLENCGDELMSDSVLCGLSNLVVKLMDSTPSIMKESSGEAIRKLVRLAKAMQRESPYIGDLIGLQKLTLMGAFTDASVLYGVAQCAKLKRVKLHSKNLTWRTDKILNILEDLIQKTIN